MCVYALVDINYAGGDLIPRYQLLIITIITIIITSRRLQLNHSLYPITYHTIITIIIHYPLSFNSYAVMVGMTAAEIAINRQIIVVARDVFGLSMAQDQHDDGEGGQHGKQIAGQVIEHRPLAAGAQGGYAQQQVTRMRDAGITHQALDIPLRDGAQITIQDGNAGNDDE